MLHSVAGKLSGFPALSVFHLFFPVQLWFNATSTFQSIFRSTIMLTSLSSAITGLGINWSTISSILSILRLVLRFVA